MSRISMRGCMTPAVFRAMALKLPGVVESAHMGHPDFRVGGKIFATLSPDGSWGMVKLKPEQQRVFVGLEPGMFEAFDNAWGRQGCTKVHLKVATKGAVGPAMVAAWENVSAGARKTATARKKGTKRNAAKGRSRRGNARRAGQKDGGRKMQKAKRGY